MSAVQLAWMRKTTRVSDHLKVSFESQRVIPDSQALVRGVQTRLEPPILRCHAGRACIGMAAHRLDATDRKQESAADLYKVGAKSDMGRDFATSCDFSRGNQRDVLAQSLAAEGAPSTAMSASTNGSPTWSTNARGAAPDPPSLPSTAMKSGP